MEQPRCRLGDRVSWRVVGHPEVVRSREEHFVGQGDTRKGVEESPFRSGPPVVLWANRKLFWARSRHLGNLGDQDSGRVRGRALSAL